MAKAVKANIEEILKSELGDEKGTEIFKELIQKKQICTESWG